MKRIVALLTLLCLGCAEPPDRSGFYNLFFGSTHRDFAAERYYTCDVALELDIAVPLPDTFETVADALVRRSAVNNSGDQVSTDTVLRSIPIQLHRLGRGESGSIPPDSVRVTIGGVLADTVHGVGTGEPEGEYSGAWACPLRIPPAIPDRLRERGYPAETLEEGQWYLFPFYAGD